MGWDLKNKLGGTKSPIQKKIKKVSPKRFNGPPIEKFDPPRKTRTIPVLQPPAERGLIRPGNPRLDPPPMFSGERTQITIHYTVERPIYQPALIEDWDQENHPGKMELPMHRDIPLSVTRRFAGPPIEKEDAPRERIRMHHFRALDTTVNRLLASSASKAPVKSRKKIGLRFSEDPHCFMRIVLARLAGN